MKSKCYDLMKRQCMQCFARVALTLAMLTLTISTSAATEQVSPSGVLFHIGSAGIRGSKFGVLREFQVRLVAAAEACSIKMGDTKAFADGILGRRTAALMAQLADCPAIKAGMDDSLPLKTGTINLRFWNIVAQSIDPPNAIARAKMMTLANENTDYTDVEFNVGTTDRGILTWGPLGATAGQAFQVQSILQKIDETDASLIDNAFGSEAPSVRTLVTHRTEPSATKDVEAVKASPARKLVWKQGFEALGKDKAVRLVYDKMMEMPNKSGLQEGIKDFFRSYWAHCYKPTEADFGFFFDRSVQMTVYRPDTDSSLDAVANIERNAATKMAPHERRRAISADFTARNPDAVGDRLARDVEYYIDGFADRGLNDQTLRALRTVSGEIPIGLRDENRRWSKRTAGARASDYGLSDERASVIPDYVKFDQPACVK